MASDQSQAAKKPTLATDREEERQGQDFISLLPDEILHTILSKLQIRDAAVTAAVSKRWAPLFPTLPSLKIISTSLNPRDPNFDPIYGRSYVENRTEWIDALFSVLDSRKTAVKKFDIAVDILEPDEDDFYQVFRDVCIAGVEELSIENTDIDFYYQIPSPVFACNTIVKLEISTCKLVVPSKLTGFRSVKSLVLWEVIVTDDHLRRMISRCKAMEKLVITDCLKVKNIVIRAPNLSELVISLGCPVKVVLKTVPQLASVAVSFSYSSDIWNNCYGSFEEEGTDDEESDGEKTFEATNLMAFLNGLRHVKNLHLNFSDEYRMILSNDGMALPARLSPKCYLVELKKLCLCFPFNYNNFNVIISCLLNSSPQLMEIIIGKELIWAYWVQGGAEKRRAYIFLQNLKIQGGAVAPLWALLGPPLVGYKYRPNDLELNFWEKQLPPESVKHHLTTATFYLDDYLSKDCLVFPNFLLLNARNLKNMTVFYTKRAEHIANELSVIEMDFPEEIQNELFAIEKVSPDVEIMVKPIISRKKYIPSF